MKPLLAATLGDPTGIGPEITVKSLGAEQVRSIARVVVVGSPTVLEKACALTGISKRICLVDLSQPKGERFDNPDTIYCHPAGPNDWSEIAPEVLAQGGQSAYDSLVTATRLALTKHVDAIVTSPLHKVALHKAGHHWPGHTELLADLCRVKDYAMMLYLPPRLELTPGRISISGPVGIGVVHVTLHMAMRDIFNHITIGSVFDKIRLAHEVFSKLRLAANLDAVPTIAVAALNPHCGEGGLFGNEEETIIRPAVELAKLQKINAIGPLSVDTLMPAAVSGTYDAVVAMYHDQGHIALKLLDMFEAVNITLGIPIIRTSVAHGTAHEIAWQNKADHRGMIQSLRVAAQLSLGKRTDFDE